MIDAYDVYCLMPKKKKQKERCDKVLKEIENKIIEAAERDENKIEIIILREDKYYIGDVLKEHHYEYSILKSPYNSETECLIGIWWDCQ